MDAVITREETRATPQWKSLSAIDRRIVGLLVEKAKTTTDQYPLTIAAIKAGANQKSNRAPIMQLDADEITDALDRLRGLGAVTEIQGGGRVPRYRHHMYEWLGVSKVELAVMAELLLRGAQTIGELRGRAARMEPIADLTSLGPHLASLRAKGLLMNLTREGRGCVVTHALYLPDELDRLRTKYASSQATVMPASSRSFETSQNPHVTEASSSDVPAGGSLDLRPDDLLAQIGQLRDELNAVRAEVTWLKQQWEARAAAENCEADRGTA
ncbi:MAG: DUF480 domain-containing protein [Pirellulales bacterium]